MAAIDWAPLDEALRAAADAGQPVTVWWRDDDAVAHTPALDRLLALAESTGWPLALAVIPATIAPSLAPRLCNFRASVLVHGLTHRDHARLPAKRAEFGDTRPLVETIADAREGLTIMRESGLPFLPVFVPPWNRIAASLVPHLAGLGFEGLSGFGNETVGDAGLVQVNTHLDPVAWHAGRGLADPSTLIARLADAVMRRLDGRGSGPDRHPDAPPGA